MSNERRTYPRAPGVIDGSWSGSGQRCRISSLSAVGCYIETLTPPDKGARCRVQLDLPQQGPVLLHAEVVYKEPGMGFAVRFFKVPSDDRERLVRAVELLIALKDSAWQDQPLTLVS